MDYLFIAGFFIAGAIFGSFLNVCAHRIPRSESVVTPRSYCPACGAQIRTINNIPILSFMLLRGRCQSCGARISLKYPLTEMTTGALWATIFLHFGFTPQLVFAIIFVTILILLSAIDIDTKIIPNKILLPAIGASLLFLPLEFLGLKILPLTGNGGVGESLLGLLSGGGILLFIALLAPVFFKKEAMGGGDIKLAAFAGIYLGGFILLALFISFFIGALAGILMITLGKKDGKDNMPFGPSIAAGSVIALLYGPELWNSYIVLAGFSQG